MMDKVYLDDLRVNLKVNLSKLRQIVWRYSKLASQAWVLPVLALPSDALIKDASQWRVHTVTSRSFFNKDSTSSRLRELDRTGIGKLVQIIR